MKTTRKLILTYGLNYLAMALAINGSTVLSNGLVIMSILILLPQLKRTNTSVALFISFILQAALFLAGSRSYLTVTFPLLTVSGLSVVCNCLLQAATVNLKFRKQLCVLSAQTLMFAALVILTVISDLIIHQLTGFGILNAFWFLLVQLGAPIALTAISCLYRHASSETPKKSTVIEY